MEEARVGQRDAHGCQSTGYSRGEARAEGLKSGSCTIKDGLGKSGELSGSALSPSFLSCLTFSGH